MTLFDVEGIDKKLTGMVVRIKRLLEFQSLALDDFLASEDTQLIVERLLELIIQSSLDINRVLLKRTVQATEVKRTQSTDKKGCSTNRK